MRRAVKWFLLLPLLLTACPEKSAEELGAATPIEAPVEATPVLLKGIARQIPEGMDDYQLLRIDWEGMKPHAAIFERFVRGSCYVRANYALAEGGILIQVAPLHRTAPSGAALDPKSIVYTEALGWVSGAKQSKGRHQRDSLGALAWVWTELESGHERIWNFSYPEPGACVAPGVLARHAIPAKLKPALRKEGPLPGETPSDPSRHPLAPTTPASQDDGEKEAAAEEAATEEAAEEPTAP